MKTIVICLITLSTLFVTIFCSTTCNKDNSLDNTYIGRFIKSDYTCLDTIIYYHLSHDTLHLKFPTAPEVNSWELYIGNAEKYIGKGRVNNSEIIVVNPELLNYSDSSYFRLLGITNDSILFGFSGVKVDFPYYTKSRGVLKLTHKLKKYYRINLNGFCETKNEEFKKTFGDSIVRIFNVDTSLLYNYVPEIKRYNKCR